MVLLVRLLRKRKQQIQYLNPTKLFVRKTAHGFSVGDVIAVSDTGDFVKANAVSKSFGVVVEAGPD